jgi:hypothetical protein
MNIAQMVREHLRGFPMQTLDVMAAIVAVNGVAETLAYVGEVVGNYGQDYDAVCHGCADCAVRETCEKAA